MLFAGIDTHRHLFQTMVLDPESGELTEESHGAVARAGRRLADVWASPSLSSRFRPTPRAHSGFTPFCEVVVLALTSPSHGSNLLTACSRDQPTRAGIAWDSYQWGEAKTGLDGPVMEPDGPPGTALK
jgi:hypothetical protein